MPMRLKDYPPEWRQISHRIRFERAGGRCEWCGAEHGKPHPTNGKPTVLTCAHVHGADTMDTRDEVLLSLCAPCHLRYDAQLHADHARLTRAVKRGGQLSLFDLGLEVGV